MTQAPNLVERVAVALVVLAISFWGAYGQKPARVISDGSEYHEMARQFSEGRTTVSAKPPFVFRVATPWLASQLDPVVSQIMPAWLEQRIEDLNGVKGFPGFYAVNVLASFVGLTLLHTYVSLFVTTPWIRLVVTTLWAMQWHAPVRFTYFYPAHVDPLFTALLFWGLLVVERSDAGRLTGSTAQVSVIALAGAFSRETILLVPVLYAIRHWSALRSSRLGDRALIMAPLIIALLALGLVRTVTQPTQAYSVLSTPLEMLREKPLYTWVLAWFFTFGPAAIALMAAASDDVRLFLTTRPHRAAYVVGCGLLGFFGGTDTERILGWAAPVIMTMLGLAIARYASVLLKAPLLSGLLGAGVVISTRIMWPIPAGMEASTPTRLLRFDWDSLWIALDKTLVIDNYSANLWSFFGSRQIHAAQLIFDIAVTIGLATYLRRRRASLSI